MEKILKINNKVEIILLYGLIFLYPLFISTWFTSIFDISKILLFSLFVGLIVTLKIINFLINGSLRIERSSYDLPVILILFSFVISTLVSSNKFDSLVVPGSSTIMLFAVTIYFFIKNLKASEKNNIKYILLVSALAVSIVNISAYFELFKLIPNISNLFSSQMFNTFGNILSSIVFIFSIVPFLVQKIADKSEGLLEKIFFSLVLIIISASIFLSVSLVLPGKETSANILNVKHGWTIAIDTFKNSPLFGVGVDNFIESYNKFRPIETNSSVNWATKYIYSSSTLLNLFTETGIVGLSSFLFFVFVMLRNRNYQNPMYVSMVLQIIALSLLPLSTVTFVALFIFASLVSKNSEKQILVKDIRIRTIIGIVFIALLMVFGYLFSRSLYAEHLYSKSIQYINQNKGLESYNTINQAVLLNPYIDRYHILSSAVNIAIAETMAQKDNLTDQEKENISKLVQQSIREAKAAVAVNEKKSSNWLNLSDIYLRISSFAQGADQFAIISLNQSILLDPINPDLRIKMGGVYLLVGNKEKALDSYKLAILAKPDLPNAHYNLALFYKENNQIDLAKASINKTLELLGTDTLNYNEALKQLQEIESLTEPEEEKAPIVEPQIVLPEDSSPEVNQDQ